jgi:hypothetical protein
MQLHGYPRDMDQATGLEYGLNVSKWIKDHPQHLLQHGLGGLGFTATLRDGEGRPVGNPVR